MSDKDSTLLSSYLVGVWSSCVFYYDAFEDLIISFDVNENGFYAYLRPWYYDITLFSWKATGDNEISIVEQKNYVVDEEGKSIEEKFITNCFNFNIKNIGTDTNIGGLEIDIFELDRPLFSWMTSEKFGRIEKDLNNNDIYRALKCCNLNSLISE
ncbi:hypothetical protein [Brevibacillus daliensis]|uniref:hypothetical protein n=1 Tax=Brevibacillus daliensis TaxID=2892995 RepID=UPI001E561B30|nr:hypothetical protein [Brevibacillus daliensis]